MNMLELRTQKGLSRVGNLSIPTGERFGWVSISKPRATAFQSGSLVGYVVMFTDSASVAGDWGQLEDEASRSVDPEEFTRIRRWDVTPFLHSDLQSDTCDEEEGSTGEISAFLDTVYDLSARGKEDYAIDVIFEFMNNLLVEGQFEACDRILSEVAIARIPPVLMVSFLTITAAAKPKLKNRHRFFSIIRRLVARQRGEKAAQRLLDGLE